MHIDIHATNATLVCLRIVMTDIDNNLKQKGTNPCGYYQYRVFSKLSLLDEAEVLARLVPRNHQYVVAGAVSGVGKEMQQATRAFLLEKT